MARRLSLALRALPALAAAALLMLMMLLLALAFVPLAPAAGEAREAVFEIPKGTWARRMAASQTGKTPVEILPDTIHLTLGRRDVLLLKNLDEVPQVFGPALMMPGQSFRLPFEQASTYSFACTAHASGQMSVIVAPEPLPGWERLAWRLKEWL